MIDAVAVVVPIHDEARLLPRCLEALATSMAKLSPALRVHVVLVLDACRDESSTIASRWIEGRGHAVVEVDFTNVGRARGIGMTHALEHFSEVSPRRLWLTTTDADTIVPSNWLAEQTSLANDGFDAFAGAIEVQDWSEYPPGFGRRFVTFYEATTTSARHHVHGANMGIRADAYRACGGFEPVSTGEDHALWSALRRGHYRSIWRRDLAVTTSARRHARAPGGFAAFLLSLQNGL